MLSSSSSSSSFFSSSRERGAQQRRLRERCETFFSPKTFIRACVRGKERKTRTAFGFLEKKKKKKRGRRGEAKRTLSRALYCAIAFFLRAIALLFFFSLVFS